MTAKIRCSHSSKDCCYPESVPTKDRLRLIIVQLANSNTTACIKGGTRDLSLFARFSHIVTLKWATHEVLWKGEVVHTVTLQR